MTVVTLRRGYNINLNMENLLETPTKQILQYFLYIHLTPFQKAKQNKHGSKALLPRSVCN